jgi:hypothetical protein
MSSTARHAGEQLGARSWAKAIGFGIRLSSDDQVTRGRDMRGE